MVYMIPCPKSPHGCDADPTGEYIVGSGKLAAMIPVFSFTKMQKAIADKNYEGEYDGIPVLKYEAALHGEVQKPGWVLYIPNLMEKEMHTLHSLFHQKL